MLWVRGRRWIGRGWMSRRIAGRARVLLLLLVLLVAPAQMCVDLALGCRLRALVAAMLRALCGRLDTRRLLLRRAATLWWLLQDKDADHEDGREMSCKGLVRHTLNAADADWRSLDYHAFWLVHRFGGI